MKDTEDISIVLIAVISIVVPLFIGMAVLLSANDGSIPDDWYMQAYFLKLIIGTVIGVMSVVGLLCSVLNVYALLKLIVKRRKACWLYIFNLVNPVVSVVLMAVSHYMTADLP